MQKTIPLNEISSVHKAKTAAIFPNAIEIFAGGKNVNFSHLFYSEYLTYILSMLIKIRA
jgi:hypothetical protein